MEKELTSMEKELTESPRFGGPFWWTASGAAQFILAVAAYKRGCGDSLMPFKAFGIASLFVGSGACAIGGALHAGGINEVEDVVRVGKSIRKRLGVPPRQQA